MDAPRFDALTRLFAHAPSRRALLPLSGSLFAPLLGALPVAAKKKKKKKTTLCLDGQTIQATKKKKKKLLKSGATPGACAPPPPPPVCTPSCSGTTCGGNDGCGGICACAAGTVCQGGTCKPCTITCTGSGTTCGNDLQIALAGGGPVYACPGRYVGNFTLSSNGSLVGAGEGEDPATNTILDANGDGRVVQVNANVSAALFGLRITGGNPPSDPSEGGGGIRNHGTLTLTACTIDKNSAHLGGGIYHVFDATGPLTLNDCVVSRNNGLSGDGGGIFNGHGVTLAINGSALTGNMAGGFGGGLYIFEGTATFDSASSVTGNTCTATANCGGGIFNFGGAVTLNGADVSGNTPNNCIVVSDCIG